MKYLITLTIILFLFTTTHAQTQIDNNYFNSGLPTYQWDMAGSPYLIIEDIEIMDGSNLIIGPGVSVIFQGHYKLNVRGSINAIGNNSGDRITFTSADGNPWNGIRFDFSDGHTILTTSKLHHCDISNAQKTGTNCQSPDPESSGGAIYVESFSDLEIVDCRIFNNSALSAHGGAIALFENSSPLIRNNSIHNNFAKKRGGGIAMFRNCDPDVLNNNIYENEAKKGGGALAKGILGNASAPCSPNVQENQITDNLASGISSHGNGGGIFICSSYLTIGNNSFERNFAYISGGAVYIKNSSNVSMEYNTFSENQANSDGGGIYIFTSSIATLNENQFQGNSAINGGGINVYSGELYASNCTFSENTASSDGGGVYSHNSTSDIQNCNFSSNFASGNGGGIYMNDPVTNSIDLNIFKSNIAYQGSALYYKRILTNTKMSIKNNLFAENYATDMATVYFQGNNNNTIFNHNTVTNNTAGTYFWVPGVCFDFEANFPDFNSPNYNFYNNIIYEAGADVVIVFDVNNNLQLQIPASYSTLAGLNYLNRDNNIPSNANPSPAFVSTTDYHLTSSSPCIDAGTNLIYPYITTIDLDNNQRIANAITDYGCYEYGSTPPAARKSKSGTFYDHSQVNVFPNPATDYLNISVPNEESVEISIYTVSGQQVYYYESIEISNKFKISLSAFSPGSYILRLRSAEKLFTERIVIQ